MLLLSSRWEAGTSGCPPGGSWGPRGESRVGGEDGVKVFWGSFLKAKRERDGVFRQ